MFEAAELNQSISPRRYDTELPRLRAKLLQAHSALRGQKFPVILIVSGADGAGKGELVHRLNEWLDPRGVETQAFWAPSDEEAERPLYWRFWRAMPARGRIGIFFGSWYTDPIIQRVYGKTKSKRFDVALDRIVAHERMLADDGAEIVKLWLHLPKKTLRKRLEKLDKEGRIAPDDWKHYESYGRFTRVSERALRHTDTTAAPWHVIEATDRRYRELTAGQLLLEALQRRVAVARPARRGRAKRPGSLRDLPHRLMQLRPTVTSSRAKHIAGQAFAMNAHENA